MKDMFKFGRESISLPVFLSVLASMYKSEPSIARTPSLSNLTCINCNRIDTFEEKSDRWFQSP